MSNLFIWLIWLVFLLSMATVIWQVLQGLRASWSQYDDALQGLEQVSKRDYLLSMPIHHLLKILFVCAVFVAALVYLFSHQWVLSIGLCLGVFILPFGLQKYLRKQRLKAYEKQLPSFLLSLASALQTGASLQGALQYLLKDLEAPLSQEIARVLAQVRLGSSFEQAIETLNERMPCEASYLLTSALINTTKMGGNLSGILTVMAQSLRQQIYIAAKVNALTSQGKMQAWVMGLLPVLILFALHMIDPTMTAYFWQDYVGYLVCAILIFLEVVGVILIRKIVGISI